MNEYSEIEDTSAISRFNKRLRASLIKTLRHTERRVIGYPQGSFPSNVYFRSRRGNNVLWWASRSSNDGTMEDNYFGHGVPGDSANLNIDVQFNAPVEE